MAAVLDSEVEGPAVMLKLRRCSRNLRFCRVNIGYWQWQLRPRQQWMQDRRRALAAHRTGGCCPSKFRTLTASCHLIRRPVERFELGCQQQAAHAALVLSCLRRAALPGGLVVQAHTSCSSEIPRWTFRLWAGGRFPTKAQTRATSSLSVWLHALARVLDRQEMVVTTAEARHHRHNVMG